MTVETAETVLGLIPFTEDRLIVWCGCAWSVNYDLKGGKRVFLWWETSPLAHRVELVMAVLHEKGHPREGHTVWVKLEHAYLAEKQVSDYREIGSAALGSEDPRSSARVLELLVTDRPSGTWQVSGSALDAIVEQTRRTAIDGAIARLKKITGQDLGSDPQKWIDEFNRFDRPNTC
jgi:hypothetical protein